MNFTKNYYTIGEVSEKIAIPAYVIRFWETKFKQIAPKKARGRRYYDRNNIQILMQIKKLLYEDQLSINDADLFLNKFTLPYQINAAQDKNSATREKNFKPPVALEASALLNKIESLHQKLLEAKNKLTFAQNL